MSVSIKRTARVCAWAVTMPVLIALAGCGMFSAKDKPRPEDVPIDARARSKEALRCPDATMVGDTQDLVVFSGSGTRIDDMRYHVSLAGIDRKCDYDNNNSELSVSVKIVTSTRIGPAMVKGEKLEVPVFVAVARPDGSIITKAVQTLTFKNKDGVDDRWLDDVDIVLPADVAGPELDVLVGFQLTHAQLQRNREHR